MCLQVYTDSGFNDLNTDVAWKVISYFDTKWKTPIRGFPVDVKSGRLRAEDGLLETIFNNERITRNINGGAIHCYRSQRYAQLNAGYLDIVLKVTGKRQIAHNKYEIAFEEIEWKQHYWWWIQIKILFKRWWQYG